MTSGADERDPNARQSCLGVDRLLSRYMQESSPATRSSRQMTASGRDTVDKLIDEIRTNGPYLSHQEKTLILQLLPMVSCGEESAVILFGMHAQNATVDLPARRIAEDICREERQHVLMLRALEEVCSDCRLDIRTPDAAAFFRQNRGPDAATRFRVIVVIDSLTCIVLSALLQGKLGEIDIVNNLLRRIRADEAKHVRLCRSYLGGEGAEPTPLFERVKSDFSRHVGLFSDALTSAGVNAGALAARIQRWRT